MVEESEAMEVENVTDYSRMLQEEMGTQIGVDHLHGKMKQAAKTRLWSVLDVMKSRSLCQRQLLRLELMCLTQPL